MDDVTRTEQQVRVGLLIGELENRISEIATARTKAEEALRDRRDQAIKTLNLILSSPILYDEEDETRHYIREKADDFAYDLGGYVAAENPGEKLYFWAQPL